jgi:hypothetical protein
LRTPAIQFSTSGGAGPSPHRRAHAAAPLVAAHDYVLHLEHLDGVLQHGEQVGVGRDHLVGDVAVHEHLAGHGAGHDVRRHARVGAADPQEVRLVHRREALAEVRVGRELLGDPAAVVLEEWRQGMGASGVGAVARIGAAGNRAGGPARGTAAVSGRRHLPSARGRRPCGT